MIFGYEYPRGPATINRTADSAAADRGAGQALLPAGTRDTCSLRASRPRRRLPRAGGDRTISWLAALIRSSATSRDRRSLESASHRPESAGRARREENRRWLEHSRYGLKDACDERQRDSHEVMRCRLQRRHAFDSADRRAYASRRAGHAHRSGREAVRRAPSNQRRTVGRPRRRKVANRLGENRRGRSVPAVWPDEPLHGLTDASRRPRRPAAHPPDDPCARRGRAPSRRIRRAL